MNCTEADNLIIDYLYGEADPPQVSRLEEHLETCPSCSEKLASYKKVIEIHKSVSRAEPSEEVQTKILEEARTFAGRSRVGSFLFRNRFAASSAAAALLFAVVGVSLMVHKNRAPLMQSMKGETEVSLEERGIGAATSDMPRRDAMSRVEPVEEGEEGFRASYGLQQPKDSESAQKPSVMVRDEPDAKEPAPNDQKEGAPPVSAKKARQEKADVSGGRQPKRLEKLQRKLEIRPASENDADKASDYVISGTPSVRERGAQELSKAPKEEMHAALPEKKGAKAEPAKVQGESAAFLSADRGRLDPPQHQKKASRRKAGLELTGVASSDPELLFRQAQMQYQQGEWEKAIELFQRYINRHPDGESVYHAYLSMAAAYRNLKKNNRALEVLRQTLKRFPQKRERIEHEIRKTSAADPSHRP